MTDQTLQKALFTIKKLKAALQEQQQQFAPVAIVGMSCRFPQASSKNGYWQMLCDGRNVITHLPERRWELLQGTDEIGLRDPSHPYWGGYFTNVDEFDAYFFGISPREAIRIDPQHRLILELAYEALEDAGIAVDDIAGTNTGIFASLYVSQLTHLQKIDVEMDALYLPTGTAISIAANRLSYLLDVHGPSVIIDSACSSSMAALHLACLNLQSKNCDLALVCGAKLHMLPFVNFVLTKAKMLSPDGQCKTFDADANGYVQGEGAGVVVLKPLKKALLDKDRIYAVITGSALNQDGKTNGLTAPNGLAQEALLRQAYATANIEPEQISYVECHGTGTFLGDPIEVQALGQVISKHRTKDRPCFIGSVKTNIGHLEPAAGIASIIKTALALHHKKIPPHLNFTTPNPHIAFVKYAFSIPLQLQDWPNYDTTRIAGISGFGFGGTNAHIVMRELSQDDEKVLSMQTPNKNSHELFTISAKSKPAFEKLIQSWIDYLDNNSEINFSQLCYNLHIRRTHYPFRLAIIAQSATDVLTKLRSIQTEPTYTDGEVFVSPPEIKKPSKQASLQNIKDLDIKAIAELYVNQHTIPWKEYEANRQYLHQDMPLHPWIHKSYWPPLGSKLELVNDLSSTHPLHAKQIISPLQQLQFAFEVSIQQLPDLQDTYNIVHAGYYLEMLAFAVREVSKQNTFTIKDHHFLSPLIATPNSLTIYVILTPTNEDQFEFHFYSNTSGQKNWIEHASGILIMSAERNTSLCDLAAIRNRCTQHEEANNLYERVINMGMPAGETIRWTKQYSINDQEILCEFSQPSSTVNLNDSFILKTHPGVFDACLQPLFRLLPNEYTDKPYIASGARRVQFFGVKHQPYFLYGKLREIQESGKKIIGDCWLINAANEVMAHFEEICLTQLDNKIQIEKIMQTKTALAVNLKELPFAERKKFITDFLVEQIAVIFSQPSDDIDINRSLRDMGIDSLMALVLMRTLEVGLETNYPMHELLEGPTINDIVNYVLEHNTSSSDAALPAPPDTTPATNLSDWISYRKKQPNPGIRLFCFPYGGGGASIYRDWQDLLPDFIEVCPIQLPGRENRLDQPPLNDINALVAEVIRCLKTESPLPFALFGHSFGSLIAFELTRQLRRQDLSLPTHLFVSAFPDPRVPTKSLDKLLQQLQQVDIKVHNINTPHAIEQLSDQQLSQLARIFTENGIAGYDDYLLDKSIMKFLLPVFIGDMGIVKSYVYEEEKPLSVPITVFVGKQDTWVSYDDHLTWLEHTSEKCNIVEFDSGHLFIRDDQIRIKMLQIIVQALSDSKIEYFQPA